MAAKKSNTVYTGTPEVTPQGVTKRGTKPPPGKVQVTHKRERRSFSALRLYSAGMIFVNAVVGISLIATTGIVDPWKTHLMWAFGLSQVVAMIPLFFPKRE